MKDACDGGRLVGVLTVAELVVMAVEDACDGGRLVDSAEVAEWVWQWRMRVMVRG